MRTHFALLLFALVTTLVTSPTIGPAAEATISVSATGEVRARPDTAEISLGVSTEAPSASASVSDNNDKMQSLLSALEQLEIAPRDIRTMQFNVAPQYESAQNRQPRKIVGYRVTNQVHIMVRAIGDIGHVLDKSVQAGANRVHNIRFSLSDRQEHLDEARRRAVRRAREKANLLAESAGVGLGRVLNIRESSRPGAVMRQRAKASYAASAVPIATGEQTLSATVSIDFAIKPAPKPSQ